MAPVKPKAGKTQASRKAAQARVRRAPAQLLADLKSQRDALASKMEEKLAKLDDKIAKVGARYEKSIKLAELQGVDATELAQKLEEAKRQQRLLRLALKAKGKR
jgi:hypothetical protein